MSDPLDSFETMSEEAFDAFVKERTPEFTIQAPVTARMEASQRRPTPTVGRIVHFYNTSLPSNAYNGVGPGPYAAVVVQRSDTYVNLLVTPPFEGAFHEGSVRELEPHDPLNTPQGRYWVWPPHV